MFVEIGDLIGTDLPIVVDWDLNPEPVMSYQRRLKLYSYSLLWTDTHRR